MSLKARPAKKDDLMLTFNLINDSLTREMSLNQDLVTLESYRKVFNEIIEATDTHLLIIEQSDELGKGTPIAHIQINQDGEMTLSLANKFRGQHLAKPAIKTVIAYIRRFPSIDRLIAHIKRKNVAALKAFEKAGFMFTRETTVNGYPCLEYIYKIPNRKYGLFY